jgi:glycosyltransferase involved in cell wall biosynthesis
VQIHDLFDDGLYRPGGLRQAVRDCGALCLTHPQQKSILENSEISLYGKPLLSRPMGAGDAFLLRKQQPKQFSPAWVGRPVQYQGRDFKRPDWFVQSLTQSSIMANTSAVLIGERLHKAQQTLKKAGLPCQYYQRPHNPHSTYPALYQQIDCLVISSEFAAGPNCLFEALACGVPVIATRCGWTEEFITPEGNGFLVDSVAKMTEALEALCHQRDEWFKKRQQIRKSLKGCSLQDWLQKNIELAVGLVGGEGSHKDELCRAFMPVGNGIQKNKA